MMYAISIRRCKKTRRELSCDRCVDTSVASRRAGLTILELLTTMGIVSTLAALLLPALNSARETARRTQCVNQLRQIGIALHSYYDQYECLPAGWQSEPSGQSAYGWLVPLLPYLDQRAIYSQIDRNRTIGHPANATARRTAIALLVCPSDIIEPTFVLFREQEDEGDQSTTPPIDLPTANYVGVFGTHEADDAFEAGHDVSSSPGDGVFLGDRAIGFAEVRRGLSNTLVVGERTMARLPSTWLGVEFRGEDSTCRLVGNATTSPNCNACDECEFDSRHPGGSNFLWGDGRVRLISENVNSTEYQRLARRSEL